MKKFNFRLQRVLEIKQTIEDVKRRNFNEARQLLETEQNKLADFKAKEISYRDKLNKKRIEGASLEIIRMYYKFFSALSTMLQYQKRRIIAAQEEVDKRRNILLEAVRERRVLENLKEKKLLEYNYEANREEQNFLDEISMAGTIRKMSSKTSLQD